MSPQSLFSYTIVLYFLLLSYYGDRWLPPWHDEAVLARIGQNLAAGNGMVNDLVGDLLPGADRKTYWQMPLYPLLLSLWGRWFSFSLHRLRMLSRLLSAGCLILVWMLALKVGMGPYYALFPLAWTSADMTFQLVGNFVRPEALTCFFFLLCLYCLPHQQQGEVSGRRLFLAGCFGALAFLSHPIAVPALIGLSFGLWKEIKSRWAFLVLVPTGVCLFCWLVWAATDWNTFILQMKAHTGHKTYTFFDYLAFVVGGTFWGLTHYLGVPVNPFLWSAVIVIWLLLVYRYGAPAPQWLIWSSALAYLSVTAGAEAWYPAFFVPLGCLLMAFLFHHLSSRFQRPFWAVLVGSLWLLYQLTFVARHWVAVPYIGLEREEFFRDLSRRLPTGSSVMIANFVPDPYFYLSEKRADIKIHQMMPPSMVSGRALKQLRQNLDFTITNYSTKGIPLLQGHTLKSWSFRFGGLADFSKAAGPSEAHLVQLRNNRQTTGDK
ncbi:MAG: glycosyltransferase family 39 protein [Armatimonadetes bacterium]|nr:glycosyltransferase family 39 protein [Armatimonadota bacterium]MDW8120794.1 hypothetical protein [Armatimonadota bacterium]